MLEAVSLSENSVSIYQITRCNSPEDNHLQGEETKNQPVVVLIVPVAVKSCNFTKCMYCIRHRYLLALSTPQRERDRTAPAFSFYHEIAMLNACFSTQGPPPPVLRFALSVLDFNCLIAHGKIIPGLQMSNYKSLQNDRGGRTPKCVILIIATSLAEPA
ncbi:MAG: hypothetical protein EZS28_006391 [Streblomastix strix]|uniref:Uncharacterized protein n=1 Tax=Streblomastix strix TaxID=222440 RepID=A0A5J4WU29_9EUKA|nr:MAG: hypothetical protein EZS28_006391 [Streblomastix strix]